MSQSLGALLEALRSRRPLIHCITNPISINDCIFRQCSESV